MKRFLDTMRSRMCKAPTTRPQAAMGPATEYLELMREASRTGNKSTVVQARRAIDKLTKGK